METGSLEEQLNSALDVENWTAHNAYRSVSVLVIYWQESDIPGFKDEASVIGDLFATEFHYAVEYYAIPSVSSYMELDKRINLFLSENGQPDHLLLLHYGGHGDPDDESDKEKLAVWAA